jgi:hypothetical protein
MYRAGYMYLPAPNQRNRIFKAADTRVFAKPYHLGSANGRIYLARFELEKGPRSAWRSMEHHTSRTHIARDAVSSGGLAMGEQHDLWNWTGPITFDLSLELGVDIGNRGNATKMWTRQQLYSKPPSIFLIDMGCGLWCCGFEGSGRGGS